MTVPIPIISKPGIKRDGTRLEGDFYIDGKWCRWQRGRPRKMGGYSLITYSLSGPPRELNLFSRAGFLHVHSGHENGLESLRLDHDHNASVISNRTPASFVSNPDNDWQFAQMFDAASTAVNIVAHYAPNADMLDNDVARPYCIGDIAGSGALTDVAGSDCSGGVVALHPYLVRYSSDGFVGWSVPNNPGDIIGAGSGNARITASKIVKGLPLRSNSGNSPAGLLWTLDSIIRQYFVGGSSIYAFDTITSQSSILSAGSVIEHDGIFYWIGVDRFLTFNGVLQTLPNDINLNFFFDNLTPGHEAKTYATKVPKFGEIWWIAPMFGSTEPNHAVIYNIDESKRNGYPVWYDTPLPEGGRGAAHHPQVHDHPFMTGVEARSGKYALWHHEYGVDKIDGTDVLAVESYFETSETWFASMENSGDAANKSVSCQLIEPDFVQSGDMQVVISGRTNARSQEVVGDATTFPDVATGPEDQVVPKRETRRQLRFKFISNTLGGDYQMGMPMAHIDKADGRATT